MKLHTLAAGVLALAVGAATANAAIVGPYTPDSNTLHLWHLDETTTPAVDQANYTYASTSTPSKNANMSLSALFGTGNLGSASLPGFNTAYNSGATPTNAGLAALTPANATTDNVDHTFDNPTTHAFTMEAIVKIGFNPITGVAAPQEIIAGEGDSGDSSDRSWQFRLEANATGATPWVLRFQKVSGFGGIGGSTANYNLDAILPTTGGDALVQDAWYHVAVTFNGDLADAANLKLYWTRMDAANTEAHLVASGQMNGWLRQQDTDFAIGNELRDFNGNTEGWNGSIDEVRISDIARSANAMQFIPEPASLSILGLAGASLLLRRRK